MRLADCPDDMHDPAELRAHAVILSRLAAYSEHRAGQLEYAAKGDQEAADACRKAAEVQHGKLPKEYRWK